MSERYRVWQEIERRLRFVTQQRLWISSEGETSPTWESVADHAAELEREARLLAMESGCTTHLMIPTEPVA